MNPFVGMIAIFGFNFPPAGWASCAGQLIAISQNTALFSLLGTQFGGNGTSNFALPNFDGGQFPIGQGNGPGLSPYFMGQMGGSEGVQLLVQNLPTHNHTIIGSSDLGDTAIPQNAFAANTGALDTEYKAVATNPAMMHPNVVGYAGGNQQVNIRQPYLPLNFCIALQGIFPARS